MISQRVRRILDQIDEVLAEGGRTSGYSFQGPLSIDAAELWHVLTGLRGPDSENEVLKGNTTAPIRRAAFPRCAQLARKGSGFAHGAFYGYDSKFRTTICGPIEHFEHHAIVAARALGILDGR